MDHMKLWWPLPVSLLLTAGLASLAMWTDLQCNPISTKFCLAWRNFSWETVLAGAIGLMGGLFVIASTRLMIVHERKNSTQVAVDREIFPYLNIVAESKRYLKFAQALVGIIAIGQLDEEIREQDATERRLQARRRLKSVEDYRNRLQAHIDDDLHIPLSITSELQELVGYMGMFDELKGNPDEIDVVNEFEVLIITFEDALERYRKRLIETRTLRIFKNTR